MTAQVYIVEFHRLSREGFRAWLSTFSDIRVTGDASSLQHAFADPMFHKSGVVLIALDKSGTPTGEPVRKIRMQFPGIRIIGYTEECVSPETLKRWLDDGLSGYFTKSSTPKELHCAIMQVMADSTHICNDFTMRLLEAAVATQPLKPAQNVNLTQKEIAVLRYVAEGYTNRDIAMKLGTSNRTIEARRKSMIRKTNTRNTAALIRYAIQYRII